MVMPGVTKSFGYPNYLAKLLHRGHPKNIPTNAGWYAEHVGSGSAAAEAGEYYITTGATASSVGLVRAIACYGLARGSTSRLYINWARELWFWCNLNRQQAGDANTIARIQLKQAVAEGVLAAKGIGFQITDLTLVGESYGTGLATAGSFALTANNEYTLAFHHLPGVSIEWFYGKTYPLTSLGKTTTAANIPSGEGTDEGEVVLSIINGATAAARIAWISDIWMWQA